MKELAYLREAWNLFQTDDRRETVVAVVIVSAILGPVVYQVLQQRGE